jgi:sigma-B regulation protein RsbU (phosphoserine phosphatase)
MITNKDGAILYINPAFEHTTGYSMDDVTGKTPRILRSGKQDSKFYEVMWATLLSGDAFRGTLINRKKSGELYHAEQTITPMCDDQGNLTHFVSVIKDLTERMASFEAAAELQVARRVQQRLYPREIPKIAGVEIAGAAQASLLMCGDYFDYFLVEDNKLGLVVGDVSGHGLGQALIMAETRAWLHSYIQTWDDPCEVLRRLNTPLIKDLSSSQFVTMCLAVVDVANRTLTYANAGHPSGYLFDKSGNPKLVLESSGIPLGVLPEVRGLTDRSVAIEPGDLILLITDGFLESPRPDGEFIKVEELFHVIREHHDAPAQEILDGLFEHLRFFMKGETQTDDITAVICRITDL